MRASVSNSLLARVFARLLRLFCCFVYPRVGCWARPVAVVPNVIMASLHCDGADILAILLYLSTRVTGQVI